MKFFSILVLVSFVVPAYGASTKSQLEKVAKSASVQNGSTSVERYDLNSFEVGAAVNALRRNLPDRGGCYYSNQVGRDTVISTLNEIEDNSGETAGLLQRLENDGLISIILYRGFSDGDLENCQFHHFEVYTNDGFVLFLNYDFTT